MPIVPPKMFILHLYGKIFPLKIFELTLSINFQKKYIFMNLFKFYVIITFQYIHYTAFYCYSNNDIFLLLNMMQVNVNMQLLNRIEGACQISLSHKKKTATQSLLQIVTRFIEIKYIDTLNI